MWSRVAMETRHFRGAERNKSAAYHPWAGVKPQSKKLWPPTFEAVSNLFFFILRRMGSPIGSSSDID